MVNILILVDMQNGFTRHPQTNDLVDRLREMLSLKLFDEVIATRFLNHDQSIFERVIGWDRLKSEDDRTLKPELVDAVSETFDKSIYTCVTPDFLQRVSQLNGGVYPNKLFVAGADTDCCVLKIAVDLFEHNVRPIVLTKYCASNGGAESHKAGLLCLERLIGSKQLVGEVLSKDSDLNAL